MRLAATVVLAAVGCRGTPADLNRHDVAEPSETDTDRQDEPSTPVPGSHPTYGCQFASTGIDLVFDEIERRLIEKAPPTSADAIVFGGHVLRGLQVKDAALDTEWFEVDESHVGALESYGCAGNFQNRLVLFERVGPSWRVTARKPFANESSVFILAHHGATAALTAHQSNTKHTISFLEIVRAERGRWRVLLSRDGLIDLQAETRAPNKLVASWAERSKSLGWSATGPLLGFEIELSLDSAERMPIPRSTTPWLHALSEFCSEPARRGRVPCGTTTAVIGAVHGERHAAITVDGPNTDTACDGEAIGSIAAGDRSLVVDVQEQRGRWQVVSARPADRGCAMTKRRLLRFRPTGNRSGTFVTSLSIPGALARGNGRIVWTDGETLRSMPAAPAPVARRELFDRPLLLADDGAAVYWVSAETFQLRRMKGDARDTLARLDMDAAGIAVLDGSVYVSKYVSGEIVAYRDGSRGVVASGLDAPMGLAAYGQQLLVATGKGIVAVDPATGSSKPTSFDALAPITLAASGDLVAWVEAGGRVLVSNGTQTRIVADAGHPTHVALDGDRVVWLDVADRTVRRARAGLSPEPTR